MKTRKNKARPVPHAPMLPKETLEIAERREVLLAGVAGIEDYHTEKVRVRTCKGIVEVRGSAISLCWAGEKRLFLRGNIVEILFENGPCEKKGGRK